MICKFKGSKPGQTVSIIKYRSIFVVNISKRSVKLAKKVI